MPPCCVPGRLEQGVGGAVPRRSIRSIPAPHQSSHAKHAEPSCRASRRGTRVGPRIPYVDGELRPGALVGPRRADGPQEIIESLHPAAFLQPESIYVAAQDAFAKDAPGKVFVPPFLERLNISGGKLRNGADRLERDSEPFRVPCAVPGRSCSSTPLQPAGLSGAAPTAGPDLAGG